MCTLNSTHPAHQTGSIAGKCIPPNPLFNISIIFLSSTLRSLQAEFVAPAGSKAHVVYADNSAGCVLLLLVPRCSLPCSTEKHLGILKYE